MMVCITDRLMPITKIDHLLKRLQPDIERIEDPNTRRLVSVLLNLVEEVVSENMTLRQENQALKDEINRLKGEHGKPTITPNTKKGDQVSCEQERRQAERLEEDGTPREGFKLDRPSLEKLKEHRIPGEVLEQLGELHGKSYSSQAEFVSAVESVVGSEVARQYGALLVTYARYKKRKRTRISHQL